MACLRIAGLNLALLMLMVGCASMVKDPEQPIATSTPWEIVQADQVNGIVVQQEVDGGLVSVQCDSLACQTLIITDAVCEVSSVMPVLVNTAIDAGAI